MESLDARGCGLDVHANTGVACLGVEGEQQLRTVSPMTADLRPLADGLLAAGCTHVALERTGVYWRPVFNLLADHLTVLLVKAHPINAGPGRKPEVRDCDGIGALLRHGLLKARFIPPRHLRALRELTRHRQSLGRERAAVANRIQQRIESAHSKLGQGATHVLGLAGRFMLQALADGEEEAAQLAQLAKGKLKAKAAPRKQSLTGHVTPSPRVLRQELLGHYAQ
jgi:transposase